MLDTGSKFYIIYNWSNVLVSVNRKEGNDQESIQLPKTFRPKHPRERRTHLKQQHHNQNITSRKTKGQYLSQKIGQMAIQNKKKFTRTYIQRHTMIEIVNLPHSYESEVKVVDLEILC